MEGTSCFGNESGPLAPGIVGQIPPQCQPPRGRGVDASGVRYSPSGSLGPSGRMPRRGGFEFRGTRALGPDQPGAVLLVWGEEGKVLETPGSRRAAAGQIGPGRDTMKLVRN